MSVKKVIMLSCIALILGMALGMGAYRIGYWYAESKIEKPERLVKTFAVASGSEAETQ